MPPLTNTIISNFEPYDFLTTIRIVNGIDSGIFFVHFVFESKVKFINFAKNRLIATKMKQSMICRSISLLVAFMGFGVISEGAGHYEPVAKMPSEAINLESSLALATDTLKLEPTNGEGEEYEIVILDPGFDSWFSKNNKSPGFYEKSYLERWNQRLVQQWNMLIGTSLPRGCTPSMYIDYRKDVDYGLEVNHKLFFYFWYVHQQCNLFHSRPGMWF